MNVDAQRKGNTVRVSQLTTDERSREREREREREGYQEYSLHKAIKSNAKVTHKHTLMQ